MRLSEKNKNLLWRILSALTLLPFAAAAVYLGGWYFGALMGVAAALVTGEYYLMTMKRLAPAAWVGIVAAGMMPLFTVWVARSAPASSTGYASGIYFWWVAGYFFFVWIYHLLRGPLAEAPGLCAHLVTGLLYASLGTTALAELRSRPDGAHWVITAFVVTWANDTLAYFAGRLLGRRKLYPAVSPNKTWEGFAGGVAGSLLGLFAYRALFSTPLTITDCILVGLVGAIVGPAGDLVESMLKRAYGVKDSGKLIPGHGGMLDRVDSVLFNGPMVFLYVQFVRGLF